MPQRKLDKRRSKKPEGSVELNDQIKKCVREESYMEPIIVEQVPRKLLIDAKLPTAY